jgi:hypothetical protein
VSWPHVFLGGFRWFRKLQGGHWERWYNDVTHGASWYQVARCHQDTGVPPSGMCRGTPVCESW